MIPSKLRAACELRHRPDPGHLCQRRPVVSVLKLLPPGLFALVRLRGTTLLGHLVTKRIGSPDTRGLQAKPLVLGWHLAEPAAGVRLGSWPARRFWEQLRRHNSEANTSVYLGGQLGERHFKNENVDSKIPSAFCPPHPHPHSINNSILFCGFLNVPNPNPWHLGRKTHCFPFHDEIRMRGQVPWG